jgi:hypothetical protein
MPIPWPSVSYWWFAVLSFQIELDVFLVHLQQYGVPLYGVLFYYFYVICVELAWAVLDFFVPPVSSNPFKIYQVPEHFFWNQGSSGLL